MRITDEAIAADGGAVARFLADLKNWPNIFVDAFWWVCERPDVLFSGAGA